MNYKWPRKREVFFTYFIMSLTAFVTLNVREKSPIFLPRPLLIITYYIYHNGPSVLCYYILCYFIFGKGIWESVWGVCLGRSEGVTMSFLRPVVACTVYGYFSRRTDLLSTLNHTVNQMMNCNLEPVDAHWSERVPYTGMHRKSMYNIYYQTLEHVLYVLWTFRGEYKNINSTKIRKLCPFWNSHIIFGYHCI